MTYEEWISNISENRRYSIDKWNDDPYRILNDKILFFHYILVNEDDFMIAIAIGR